MRAIVAAVLLLTFGHVGAQTMYKCEDNGKIVYSDKPCATGVELKRMAPNGGPTPEDVAKSRMRASAERQREIDQQHARAAGRGAAPATTGSKTPASGGK